MGTVPAHGGLQAESLRAASGGVPATSLGHISSRAVWSTAVPSEGHAHTHTHSLTETHPKPSRRGVCRGKPCVHVPQENPMDSVEGSRWIPTPDHSEAQPAQSWPQVHLCA